MGESSEITLRAFMIRNTYNLRGIISSSLALTELLGKLHQRGLLRSNFNPEYICVNSQSGLLNLLPINQSKSIPDDEQSITLQDELISDFAYISPEQTGRMKRKIDQRSDLYALGVLLYEMLTGELPYKANTANEWIHAHMAVQPNPPGAVNPVVPQLVNDLVMKLLSKSAENRYQTAYGLYSDLKKLLDQMNGEENIGPILLGEADERSRFRLTDHIYGREEQLQELFNAFERSCSGSIELTLIGGHAGNGKTALVKAMQMPVIHQNGYFISGKFDQQNQSTPYAALILAFRGLIRQILAENDEQVAEWKNSLMEALGQSGIVITEVISELTLIIGEQPPVTDLPPVELTNRFQTLFSSFIKVFANKKHPLVISLDDLQWADPASLQLLQVLIHDPSNRYLFIIGAYRNNEIHEGHLLEEIFLRSFRTTESMARFMTLEALEYPNVVQYVADVLQSDSSRIKPLAEIIYRKTAGNPLYVKQMLQFIYDEKLLYFDADQTSWDWNTQSIMDHKGFKDVISLIVGRFNALPEETHGLLRLAGCMGNSFDIRMLSLLYEQGTEQTEQDLLPALNEGLVLVEQDTYVFLHDRMQKAAYDLIPDEDKKRVHLKIGGIMLRFFDSEATDEHLFEVVHHLNLGSEFMSDLSEIEQLARLNLQAGRKAKASAAYVRALELLRKGAQLIEVEGRSRLYELYFYLLLESTECEYFCGYFAQAEATLEQLLLRVENPVDRAKVYIIQITMCTFRKQEGDAAEIALKAMAEFGLNVPLKPSRLSIMAELAHTQMRLTAKRSLLMNLPIIPNPMHQALADIVMASSSILFIVNEELAVVLFAKYVRMSLKQGHSEAFSIALGSYAVTLALGLKSYRTALRLAEVALNYSEKTDNILLQGKIQLMMALILQFLRPQEVNSYFQRAGKLSLEGGDMVYAGNAISCQLISGSKYLQDLRHLCNIYAEKPALVLDEITLRVLYLTIDYVQLLQNATDSNHLTFSGGYFDEGKLLLEETSSNQHKGNLYYYYTCKLEIYYLYARYPEAVVLAEQSDKLYASMLLLIKIRHCFYHALAIMAVYSDTPDYSKRSYRKAINKLLAQMKQWAKVVPESTSSKYRIMLAEWARLNRDYVKAAKLYNQAIQAAEESSYPQDEAIANELAAHYYLSQNKYKLAEDHLQASCKAYYKWGAFGKVKSMQERHSSLKQLSFIEQETLEDLHNAAENLAAAASDRGLDKELDMNTLLQASKIVSTDKVEADLLESFLDLAILNTGAEKGFVLLDGEGALVVEAKKDINGNSEKSVDNGDFYSTAVIQFVMRTRESVILGEAHQSIFASDPYIRLKQPKSILCLPIHYPDSRIGVLYLENNLISDAFIAGRLEVLEMVFSRMAYLKLGQAQKNMNETIEASNVRSAPARIELLTEREMEILNLMAEGLSNKEIALRLIITEGTVKNHVFNLYGKLEVKRRVQAISKARELQLLEG